MRIIRRSGTPSGMKFRVATLSFAQLWERKRGVGDLQERGYFPSPKTQTEIEASPLKGGRR